MKILITGGTGFVGSRLARELLKRGSLNGARIDRLVLADQFPAPEAAADVVRDARVEVRVGPLLAQCEAFRKDRFDGVFHLASAVSGECEADFELGLRSNLDSTRALLDALRAAGNTPRFVFSSSVAVFGPDASNPMPPLVRDDTLPTPQTSYGTHKLVCEHLVADYTRKGFIDGRSARLMTVTVRPGKPNGAASSFFSGIIREPLAGQPAILPVDPSVSHPVSSPARTVEGLIAVFEASQEAMGGRAGLNLPSLNVTVAQMLEALESVAGKATRALVKAQPDPTIQRIVAGWSKGAVAARAEALGLKPEREFADIILQYIADNPAAVTDTARAAAANYKSSRLDLTATPNGRKRAPVNRVRAPIGSRRLRRGHRLRDRAVGAAWPQCLQPRVRWAGVCRDGALDVDGGALAERHHDQRAVRVDHEALARIEHDVAQVVVDGDPQRALHGAQLGAARVFQAQAAARGDGQTGVRGVDPHGMLLENVTGASRKGCTTARWRA